MEAPDLNDIPDPETPLDKLRAALIDTDGLDSIPEPETLINSILFRDSLAWLGGRRGQGKSFVALDMAGCVATGLPWQHFAVPSAGPVLYVAAEGVSGIKWRVRAWEEINGRMDGVQWLPMPVQVDSREWGALIDLAAEIQPALVVIDTQARCTVGMEENAAKDMGELVHHLDRLRKASGACVLVVHHQGHNGDHMRGSTALEGAAETIVQVSKDEDLVVIKNSKQKNAVEFDDVYLRLVETGPSAVLTTTDAQSRSAARGAAGKLAAKWWDVFRDEQITVNKLTAADVTTERSFYRHARTLIDEQIVVKEQVGRTTYYRLLKDPSEGDD